MTVSEPATLSIGALATRTGLTPTALRMWEQRHGFPVPHRRAGGHRRYTADDVRLVREVVRRRESGMRLEDAIADVRRAAAPTSPSVFATLRRRHHHLPVHRLRKSTLLAMSWAIEDQVVALAERPTVWGSFQRERYYRAASARWEDLARGCDRVTVFADFGSSDPASSPRRVRITDDAPLSREWAVVVDCAAFPIALSAWELPGQGHLADRSRVFESVWTLEPPAVRDASRVCAGVAGDVDPAFSGGGSTEPPLDPGRHEPSLASVTGLFGRMAAYVDRFAPVEQRTPVRSEAD